MKMRNLAGIVEDFSAVGMAPQALFESGAA
jgi:hypothetical protein